MKTFSSSQQQTFAGLLIDNRYVLVQPLGSGGSGVVYKAEDRLTGEIVALKLLRRRSVANGPTLSEMRALLRQEAQILADIRHPQIPRLRGHKLHGDVVYLALEYIDGVTLEQLLAHERLPRQIAARLGDEICGLVDFLHRRRPSVLHLDLKPANILISDGRAYLIDFGLARRPGDQPLGVQPMGTPPYAPYEQRAGHTLDHRADVYALGHLLQELFAGVALPVAVQDVLDRATEPLPSARYASVAALRTALQSACRQWIQPRAAPPAPRSPARFVYQGVCAVATMASFSTGFTFASTLGHYVC